MYLFCPGLLTVYRCSTCTVIRVGGGYIILEGDEDLSKYQKAYLRKHHSAYTGKAIVDRSLERTDLCYFLRPYEFTVVMLMTATYTVVVSLNYLCTRKLDIVGGLTLLIFFVLDNYVS